MFGNRFFGARFYGPRYWGDGGTGTPPFVSVTHVGGVRRSRFLRRGPRLPWEHENTVEESGSVVVTSRRIKIALPEVARLEKVARPIPVQTFKELDGIIISVPELGSAHLAIDEIEAEDEWLWLI